MIAYQRRTWQSQQAYAAPLELVSIKNKNFLFFPFVVREIESVWLFMLNFIIASNIDISATNMTMLL